MESTLSRSRDTIVRTLLSVRPTVRTAFASVTDAARSALAAVSRALRWVSPTRLRPSPLIFATVRSRSVLAALVSWRVLMVLLTSAFPCWRAALARLTAYLPSALPRASAYLPSVLALRAMMAPSVLALLSASLALLPTLRAVFFALSVLFATATRLFAAATLLLAAPATLALTLFIVLANRFPTDSAADFAFLTAVPLVHWFLPSGLFTFPLGMSYLSLNVLFG